MTLEQEAEARQDKAAAKARLRAAWAALSHYVWGRDKDKPEYLAAYDEYISAEFVWETQFRYTMI